MDQIIKKGMYFSRLGFLGSHGKVKILARSIYRATSVFGPKVLANAVNRPPTATKNHRLRAVVFDTEIDELVPVDYTNERTRDCTESGSNFLAEIELWTS